MSFTGKTSAQNLDDLLADVAVRGADWLEAREAGEGIPMALEAAYLGAIDNYTRAAHEHEEQNKVLRQIEGDRVWTMDEIEEAD